MIKLAISMAFTNIRNNRKTFIPYMLSSIMTTAIFYIICSLGDNEELGSLWGGNILQSYMSMGQVIVAIFAVIFLFYINSFLIRRRQSEFGLYNILGMEKRHISTVIFFETLYSFLISMIFGLAAGMLLDKLMYLIVLNLLDAAIPLGFYISSTGIAKACGLFGIIFLLIFLSSVRRVYKSNPIELLASKRAGEKEPKAKWVLAAAGLVCLLTGYAIAVFTENPVAAVMMFFVAVVLVIIGTYLLFTAGSIALLKLLRMKKGFYYKARHFVSISGMMYRMKKNAVGLASICILSTMVLVMISSVLFMFVGNEDSVNSRFPAEYKMDCISGDPLFDRSVELLAQNARDEGLRLTDEVRYEDLSFSAVYDKKNDRYITDPDSYGGMSNMQLYNNLTTLFFVTLDDYNKVMKQHESLNDGEILVHATREEMATDRLNIFDMSFKVKKTLDSFIETGDFSANTTISRFAVVKDRMVIEELYEKQQEAYGSNMSYIRTNYMADAELAEGEGADGAVGSNGAREDGAAPAAGPSETLEGSDASKAAVAGADTSLKARAAGADTEEQEELYKAAAKGAYGRTIEDMSAAEFNDFTGCLMCRTDSAEGYFVDFSGLFFIGIFLGLLFVTATVLIVYYKQITEGYEDKERFEIMQNVGMSHAEVRRSINSQILMVFFLPLITAGIHVLFAFPFIFRIMMLIGLFNMKLYALCTAGCFLAFGVFYTVVYLLTARMYYGIVKK